MTLGFVTRIKLVAAVASALLVVASGPGLGQQQKGAAPAPKKDDPSKGERVSGVILKVEKVAKAGKEGEAKQGPVLLRISVNTNAVWRDWARDQAQVRDDGSPRKDAAKGAESVATKGQPADENSVAVIEVTAATRIETRFRSPSDETTKGETAPEKVKSDESTTSKAAPAGKAVKFRAEDLLPGLFVEADFRPSGSEGKDRASTVTVIRPISVLESSPAAQSPPK